MPDLLFAPVPNDAAAKFIASKPVLAREVYDQLLPELRARAFTITGLEDANVMQAVRDRIADLPRGADWDSVKSDVAKQLSPWLDAGAEEKGGGGGLDDLSASQRRAELLLRTNGFQAYSAAQYEVMDRQRGAFPYWQYLTMEDERVRDSHAALDQLVLPADSPFWADHYPPWDWGCRCQVVPLLEEDVADLEAADADKDPEAQRVLDDNRLNELEKNNRLITAGENGMPEFVSVSPNPSYAFKPGTLKMTVAELRARYDADTWSNFESWAKGQKIDAGQTVWDWLNREPATPTPRRQRALRP